MSEITTLEFRAKREKWDEICAISANPLGLSGWPPIMLDGHGLIRIESYVEDGDTYKVAARLESELIYAFTPEQ